MTPEQAETWATTCDGDLEALTRLYLLAKNDAAEAASARNTVETFLAQAMDKRKMEVPGLATLERHRDISRKGWDHSRIAAAVAAHAVAHPVPDSDGVVADPVDRAVAAVLAACGINYWKVSVIAPLVDVASVCDEVESGWKVTVRPVAEAAA